MRFKVEGTKVNVEKHRAKSEWTEFIKQLIDEQYPGAKKIVLVMDNLNTPRFKNEMLYMPITL